MRHRRRLAHLLDLAGKGASRERVNRKRRHLRDADAPDIGFINRRFDLHVGEVLRNDEELGCLQTRGYGLARLDRFFHHNTGDRRADRGACQIDARLRELRFALIDYRVRVLHVGFGDAKLRLGGVECGNVGLVVRLGFFRFRGGNEILLDQGFFALEVTFGLGEVGIGTRYFSALHRDIGGLRAGQRACSVKIGLRLPELVFKLLGVDARDQLALFDLGVEVGEHLLQLPRDL